MLIYDGSITTTERENISVGTQLFYRDGRTSVSTNPIQLFPTHQNSSTGIISTLPHERAGEFSMLRAVERFAQSVCCLLESRYPLNINQFDIVLLFEGCILERVLLRSITVLQMFACYLYC